MQEHFSIIVLPGPKDSSADRITLEAAMAKLFATEAAQRVIDEAVQIIAGSGVVIGFTVEQL